MSTLTSKHRNILPGINLGQQLSSDGHHRPWGTQGWYDLDWGCVIWIISLQEFNTSNSLLNMICGFSFKTWSLNRIKTNCTPYSQFNHVLTRDGQSLTQCHMDNAELPLWSRCFYSHSSCLSAAGPSPCSALLWLHCPSGAQVVSQIPEDSPGHVHLRH